MKVIAKHVKSEGNKHIYNITKMANKDSFDELVGAIEDINEKKFKPNLTRSKNYPDNLYFSIFSDNPKTEPMRRYNMEIKLLPVNKKGYVNVNIVSCKRIDTPYDEAYNL